MVWARDKKIWAIFRMYMKNETYKEGESGQQYQTELNSLVI